MIKIALVSHSPYFTGAEKMLFQLALILQQTNQYMPVVAIPDSRPTDVLIKMCKKHAIETVYYPANRWYIWSDATDFDSLGNEVDKEKSLIVSLLLKYDIDIVIVNTLTQIAPVLAARELDLPVCLWIHGILDSYMIPQRDASLRLLIDRWLMQMSDQIVFCSEWTANYYAPMAAKPTHTISNWVEDPHNMFPLINKNTFVCLNTFDINKGVDTLIEAVEILVQKGYRFSLHLYGTGGEEAHLRRLVQEKTLEDIIHFCGRTDEVNAVYQNCLCLIQPSYIESFGLTMVEAMANGRPVISAQNGGADTIVKHGETGYLVPKKDAGALAEKMAKILSDPELAEKMGLAGRKRYEELFSPERARQEFINVLDTMIQSTAKPSPIDLLLEDTWRWILFHKKESVQQQVSLEPSVRRPTISENINDVKTNRLIERIKRIVGFWREPDLREMIRNLNPTMYEEACNHVLEGKTHPIKKSKVIPWNGYVEYTIKGSGTNIWFILLGNDDDSCMVEVVSNNRIIFNKPTLVKNGHIVNFNLGSVNGSIGIRLKAMRADSKIHTVEYFRLWKRSHHFSLFSWIS